MNAQWIRQLREDLGLSQAEFGQLFGVHPMTASRWERGVLAPSPYQQGLMLEFRKSATRRKTAASGSGDSLSTLLVSLGIVGVLFLLLKEAKDK